MTAEIKTIRVASFTMPEGVDVPAVVFGHWAAHVQLAAITEDGAVFDPKKAWRVSHVATGLALPSAHDAWGAVIIAGEMEEALPTDDKEKVTTEGADAWRRACRVLEYISGSLAAFDPRGADL